MMIKSEDIIKLEKCFKELNTEHDGRLTRADLNKFKQNFSRRTSFSENEMDEIFDSIADPVQESISFSEFIQAAMDKRTQLSQENLDRAFVSIAAGEQFISFEKLRDALVFNQDSEDGRQI